MKDEKIDAMLQTNVRQKVYYEVASAHNPSEANGPLTNLWRHLRNRAFSAFGAEQKAAIAGMHRGWIGDVSGLKVLELGVGNGSPLSLELARNAREYVAIDLSEKQIRKLRRKLKRNRLLKPDLKVYAADFLGPNFEERDFDVIYALALFHHFEHFEAFLDVIDERLVPGGRVVTRDPVGIWWPMRLLRAAYRPFQTDADWEYPFDDAKMDVLERRFEVLDRRGLMGRSKWAAIVAIISPSLGARLAEKWHDADLRDNTTRRSLRSCLQVCYHLRRK